MPHHLLHYETAPDFLDRRGAYRDAHLRHAWEAVAAGTLLLGGAVGEPVAGALLLFTDHDGAATFAAADPYVRGGLVTSWRIEPWVTVVGPGASTPIHPADA